MAKGERMNPDQEQKLFENISELKTDMKHLIQSVEKHETRLSNLERFQYLTIGAVGIIQILAIAVFNYLLKS